MKAKYNIGILTILLISSQAISAQSADFRGTRSDNAGLVVNNYYSGDYGYYASRINRFHRSYVAFDYYSPVFTDEYWYGYRPFSLGINIYGGGGFGLGFSWNFPLLRTILGFNYSWYDPFYESSYYLGYDPLYTNYFLSPLALNISFGRWWHNDYSRYRWYEPYYRYNHRDFRPGYYSYGNYYGSRYNNYYGSRYSGYSSSQNTSRRRGGEKFGVSGLEASGRSYSGTINQREVSRDRYYNSDNSRDFRRTSPATGRKQESYNNMNSVSRHVSDGMTRRSSDAINSSAGSRNENIGNRSANYRNNQNMRGNGLGTDNSTGVRTDRRITAPSNNQGYGSHMNQNMRQSGSSGNYHGSSYSPGSRTSVSRESRSGIRNESKSSGSKSSKNERNSRRR
jgi:hypothetical protein